ncbi:MAG: methyltransferase [Clostridium sp.]|nr:methyltransferase [Clostridium sp.]
MDSREKISRALAHRSGPVPLDIGATSVTGVHISIVEKLREYYGLEKRPVRLMEPLQMLGTVDEDLKQVMGIDTTQIWNPNTIFGFRDEGCKEWRTPWGQDILVPDNFETFTDARGDVFLYVAGDRSLPPTAKMPLGGYFFDCLLRGEDYDEDNLHVEDNLEEFGYISDEDLESIRTQCESADKSGYGVIAAFGGTGIGDVAFVPGSMLKHPKGIRDIEEWYIATLTNQDYLHAVFEKQTDIALENLKKIKETVGDVPQAAFTCGTDFGTQKCPFCSNETFRNLYMPYYKKINKWIHANTSWKTFKHSCGSIKALIPELIECGFDILNPVQWTAENMDPRELKKEFGKDIVFWGGGVDTQKTFAFGKAEQVREEVLEMCRIFSEGGGFVFNTIHNIQAMTPVENIVAMIDAVKEFNR